MPLLTTKQVIVRVAVIISSAEFLIMLLLGVIPHGMDTFPKAALDVIALVVLSTPPIYLWVVKPFVEARDLALTRITHLAHVDPLTQLVNRRSLMQHLEKTIAGCIRHKLHGAVLLLDLDEFKPINDAHGHNAGDAVLVEIAERIQSITRSEDVIGRLGGDEFIVLLNNLDDDGQIAHDKASQIAKKLIKLVNNPINYNGKMLHVSASIGIRHLDFEVMDTDTAINEADIAMYRAKQAGKGGIVVFEE